MNNLYDFRKLDFYKERNSIIYQVIKTNIINWQIIMDPQKPNQPLPQHDIEHQQLDECELCQAQVPASSTCAGPFNRICKECYNQQIDHLTEPIHLISEGIYIGSMEAPRNEPLLKHHKIGAICVCGPELKLHDYEQLKVDRRVLKILDTANQNIISEFAETVKWITEMRNKNKNVLIHCAGGVSRSASICIAYFMQAHKMPYQDSYLHVKRGRKCIKPNQNFVQQLKKYEKELK